MPSKLYILRGLIPKLSLMRLSVSVLTAGIFGTILFTMKALSESHRVLGNLIIRAYHKSQTLPLSTDEKFSILFLLSCIVYCFVIYPIFICPTADIPGPYSTSTAIGHLSHIYHKHHDDADQWALELHKIYGPVVRLTPTFVSVNNSSHLSSSGTFHLGAHGPKSSAILSNSITSPFSKIRSTENDSARSTATSMKEHVRESDLFQPIISAVINDLRVALRGQKTVDIHELLSRHLGEQAPASFAIAMAHTIYQLSHPMHRHFLNRLAKEICSTIYGGGEDDWRLDMLDAVIKESLRMQQAPNHHAVTFKVENKGMRLGDVESEQGVDVAASLYCVSRNSTIFDRPHEFNPNRWLEDANSRVSMEDALAIVLDYHRRIKPGFHVTVPRLKVLLSNILKNFDMKLPLGEQPQQLDVVALKNGQCRVQFRERRRAVEKKVRFAEHVVM